MLIEGSEERYLSSGGAGGGGTGVPMIYDQYREIRIDGTLIRDGATRSNHFGWNPNTPARLARAILIAAKLPEDQAESLSQLFVVEFFHSLPRGPFRLELDIAKWIEDAPPIAESVSPVRVVTDLNTTRYSVRQVEHQS